MPGFEHVAQYIGAAFVSGIWQGLVLAVTVGLCLLLVPKATAALRFAIWMIVLIVIALLPFIAKFEAGHSVRPIVSSMLSLNVRWSLLIAATWLAASLFRAVDLAVHGLRLWSLRKRATPIKMSGACETLLSSGPRHVELCTSTEVDRPSVVGFFAPRILIPAWLYEQLSASEMEQIVLHEMEHLRRGDDWLNLLQKLSLILLPLNPIVMWVERRLCFERELACDDGVLRRTRAPRAYASCLTNLAERGLNRRTGLLALGLLGAFGAVARESELARRVHRILRRQTALSPIWSYALIGTVALGLLGGAVALGRCPQLVSFASPVQPLRAEATPPAIPSVAPVAQTVADREIAPPRAEQVVFKESDAPQMRSLTTERRPRAANRHAVRKISHAVPTTSQRVPAVRQVLTSSRPRHDAVRSWVVLSSWSESARPQMVIPVVDYGIDGNTVVPYAAVPTLGGWLIIQL